MMKSLSLGVVLSFAGATCALGQAEVHGLWVTAGIGASTARTERGNGDLLGQLAAHGQIGPWTGSVRYQDVGADIGPFDERVLTPMIGYATTNQSFGFGSISIGPSLNWLRNCTAGCGLFADTQREEGPRHDGFGLMVAGDLAFRIPTEGGVSLGVSAFANANTQKSFIGFAIEVGAGKWR